MRTTLALTLTRSAKSQGGDRYEVSIPTEPKPLVFYFPQSISRADGPPFGELFLTVSTTPPKAKPKP